MGKGGEASARAVIVVEIVLIHGDHRKAVREPDVAGEVDRRRPPFGVQRPEAAAAVVSAATSSGASGSSRVNTDPLPTLLQT
jgi:hypothetical protein